jgi:hypothetical protein
MQNLTSTLSRLAVVLTGALALGACSRAEYATLPRSASYLGSTTVASVPRAAAPVAAPQAATPKADVATTTPAVAPLATAVPVVVPAPVAASAVAAAPVAASAVAATPAPAAAAPAKLNLVQRLALAKVTKKLDKLAAKSPQFKQRDATASTTRIDGNLRTGIILVLVGLLVGIFSGLIGTIIALIGVIFIVLWLLDSL